MELWATHRAPEKFIIYVGKSTLMVDVSLSSKNTIANSLLELRLIEKGDRVVNETQTFLDSLVILRSLNNL
jgi:hypothetical protein